jgi:VIT1/CCC1 family predicted Fe2+/Mn2+ transporter
MHFTTLPDLPGSRTHALFWRGGRTTRSPTPPEAPILTAGIAGLVGGAISMALGEYVSVSSQSDSERALIVKEKRELLEMPAEELQELAGLYQAKGLRPETAHQVALELTAHDAVAAHLSAELNIDENDVVSAWHAAGASAVAFTIGALLPLFAILLPPAAWRVPATFAAVLIALALTGWISAQLGGSSRTKSILRVVIGGAIALIATYGIGSLLGATGVVYIVPSGCQQLIAALSALGVFAKATHS